MPRNQGTSRKGKPKKEMRAAGFGKALQRCVSYVTNSFSFDSSCVRLGWIAAHHTHAHTHTFRCITQLSSKLSSEEYHIYTKEEEFKTKTNDEMILQTFQFQY